MAEASQTAEELRAELPNSWTVESVYGTGVHGYSADPETTPEEELVSVRVRRYKQWSAVVACWNDERGMTDVAEQAYADSASEAVQKAAQFAEDY